MQAFIGALVAIIITSAVAAVALNNFAGSSESVNTSSSVRLN